MDNEKTFPGLKNRVRRREAEEAGRRAELLSQLWYEARGYSTLGCRMRTARGEIDLVVSNAQAIVFVEVKARRSERVAVEAVTRRQQIRLCGAAEIILAENPGWRRDQTRFDVMLVVYDAIMPIPDAFRWDDF